MVQVGVICIGNSCAPYASVVGQSITGIFDVQIVMSLRILLAMEDQEESDGQAKYDTLIQENKITKTN